MSYLETKDSRGPGAVAALESDDDLPGAGTSHRRPFVRGVPPLTVQPVGPVQYPGVRRPSIIQVARPSTQPIRVMPGVSSVTLGPMTRPGVVRPGALRPARPGFAVMPTRPGYVKPSLLMPIPGATPAPVTIVTPPNGVSSSSSSVPRPSGGSGGSGGAAYRPPSSFTQANGAMRVDPEDDLPEADDAAETPAAPAPALTTFNKKGLIVAGIAAAGLLYYLTRRKR